MIELLVLAVVVGSVVLVVRLIIASRRNKKALVAHVRERGWQWLDQVPDPAGDGSAVRFPTWLRPAQVSHLRIREHDKAVYRNCYLGAVDGKAVCGFDRHIRRRRGKDEGRFATLLVLHDTSLPPDLPEFFLVRSHGLTDAIARLDDGFRRLDEDVSGLVVSDYGLREAVPGFERWRVHGTRPAELWLASAPGARLAHSLQSFDAIAQHAFGVSGNLVIAEGMSGSIERMEALLADTLEFCRILHQAIGDR